MLNEKRCLQIAVGVACLVPIGAGLAGAIAGAGYLGQVINLDSHFRYLSGLLLGIGIAFAAAIPAIEQQSPRFRLLTFIVFTGGLARLGGVITHGLPGTGMQFGLGMELVVTPLLCAWQHRIARIYSAKL